MKTIFLLFLFSVYSFGLDRYSIAPKDIFDKEFMSIKILDSVLVDFYKIDGENFFGISGLAYDKQSDILYALNDRGRLFTFKLKIKDKKIESLKPLCGYRLKNQQGRKILKPRSDSEGMTLVAKNNQKSLWISFERQPRIEEFNLVGNGYKKKMLKLPKRLQNIKNYQGKNGALESVTYHPKYGLLTTAEYPLKGQKDGYHGIFNSDKEVCKFKKEYFDNAITELETMPDGNLLLLQRDFQKRNFKISITLKKLYLNDIKDGICKVKNLAVMKTDDGWNLDNFEGLTHYKDNIYLMISDDNGFFLQNTILTMFEIVN